MNPVQALFGASVAGSVIFGDIGAEFGAVYRPARAVEHTGLCFYHQFAGARGDLHWIYLVGG